MDESRFPVEEAKMANRAFREAMIANQRRDAGQGQVSLTERFEPIFLRVRRLLWVRSAALSLVGWVLLVIGLLLLDWWLRPETSVGRLAISVFAVMCLSLYALGCWYCFWRKGPTRAAVARRFERIHPELGDRLSSAVAIEKDSRQVGQVGHDGQHPVSPLAQAAIESVLGQFMALQPEKAIDGRTAWLSGLGATAMMLCLAFLVGAKPEVFGLAASRLLQPTSEMAWPRRDRLFFDELPANVSRGKEARWFLRNQGGALPSDTVVFYRLKAMADGGAEGVDERELPIQQNGLQGTLLLANVRESFLVRAVGGDDRSMPWQEVEVHDSVEVERAELRFRPPTYSGLSDLVLQGREAKVLAGTEMSLVLEASDKIESAVLVFEGLPGAKNGGDAKRLEASIGTGKRHLDFGPVLLSESGTWRLDWVDRHGIQTTGQERWEIEVQADAMPRVELTQPEADREVTATAIVSLGSVSEDDLGIRSAWFLIEDLVSGEQMLEEVRDYANDFPSVERGEAVVDLGGSFRGQTTGTLEPGRTLEVRAIAEDIAGQRGESPEITLRIVTPERIESRIAEHRSEAVEEIREALGQQQVALEQSEAAETRIDNREEALGDVLDRLLGSLAAQRAAEQRLAGETASALANLEKANRFAKENRLSSEDNMRLAERLRTLVDGPAADAQESLQAAIEKLRAGNPEAGGRALREAISAQQSAAETLSALSGELQQRGQLRELGLQLDALFAGQKRLSEETGEIGVAMESRLEQERLARRQRDLARQANEIVAGFNAFVGQKSEVDQAAVTRTREAVEALLGEDNSSETELAGRSLEARMREAAQAINEARPGQALQLQAEAARQINQARQRLRDETPGVFAPAEERRELANELEQNVEALFRRQSELATAGAVAQASQWGQQQLGVARETRRVALESRASDGSVPPGVAETLGDAAMDMELAAALAQREGDPDVVSDTARAAARRLELVLDALAPEAERERETGETPEPALDPAERQASADGTPVPLESLRLARGMQAFLRERTLQLEREALALEPSQRQSAVSLRNRQQRQAVAEEQMRLADRLEQWLETLQRSEEVGDVPN